MSTRPKSGLDALNMGLDALDHHQRSSHTPQLPDGTQRQFHDQLCMDKVDQARNGNTDAAREILEDFVRSVRRHSKRSWPGPVHRAYARYLADALADILDGSRPDAAIALGIKTSRAGRRKGAATHNSQALAAGFWLLRRYGLKTEECNSKLQSLTGADRTTIQDAKKAKFTVAMNNPDIMPDHRLKAIVAKERKWGGKLLRWLRTAQSSKGHVPPD